ncbi:MAG: hypothetical protein LQ352_000838 [Teloschistes flavicans]|nr:MAG: hypothetical protein LQ352_000838 [Teloschistes flavicans]
MSDGANKKLEICVSFILEQLKIQNQRCSNDIMDPFFLAMNGLQGAGKSHLVSFIASTLRKDPYNIATTVLSIDDFYLSNADQTRLAKTHPNNPLVHHRGQPSTHDLELATSTLASLRAGHETSIPSYDKSAFGGKGDRVTQSQWVKVNEDKQQQVKLVILEGWCLGFRSLSESRLREEWEKAVQARVEGVSYLGRLGHNRLEDVRYLNEALKGYDVVTNQLDALIHLDAEDLQYVYAWRLEQEAMLREEKGSGMTDEEVSKFVDGYYPSYELFTEQLRAGVFEGRKGSQLRIVIGKDRNIKEVVHL